LPIFRSVISALPDKGERIKLKVEELRKVLKNREDEENLVKRFDDSMIIDSESNAKVQKRKDEEQSMPPKKKDFIIRGQKYTMLFEKEKKIEVIEVEEAAKIVENAERERQKFLFESEKERSERRQFQFQDQSDDEGFEQDEEQHGEDEEDLDSEDSHQSDHYDEDGD